MQIIKLINEKIAFYRIIKLRKRYLFTKTNRLRLRYIIGSAVISSMMLTSLLGSMGTSIAFVPPNAEVAYINDISGLQGGDLAVDQVLPPQEIADYSYDEIKQIAKLASPQDYVGVNIEEKPDFVPIEEFVSEKITQDNKKPKDGRKIIKIKQGGTLAGALQDIGISGAEAYRIVKSMSKYYDPRSVKAGQEISIEVRENPEQNSIELISLNMKISKIKDLVISREDNDDFLSKIDEKEITLHVNAGKTSIRNSLSGSAARDGIPSYIVAQLMKIYSYNVDFQRDIRKGDKVEVLYETYETEDGDIAKYGNIIYANLMVGGRDNAVYRYASKDGTVDFYRKNGESLKRILMQTPIDGARMSSGFGMRRHPVLGYSKMHKGTDFAAPRGTPIYAAGDGVVKKASRLGSFGNYVRIRHNRSLETAYAHMKKFAKGIKVGSRVKQGQIIGYVGTTGRSTGPHLHFEVIKNNKQVSPKSISASSGKKLTGSKLAEFKREISAIKRQYAELAGGMKFAKNSVSE